jgi:hypothetical protein
VGKESRGKGGAKRESAWREKIREVPVRVQRKEAEAGPQSQGPEIRDNSNSSS